MSLKVGNVASETQFYVVSEILDEDQIVLLTDTNEKIVVSKAYAEAHISSADEYNLEMGLTRTELAQLFISSPNVALTINFNKQVKEADVLKEIQNVYQTSTPKELDKKLKKVVKIALEGEERTMKGRHTGSVDSFGRVYFTDMEIAHDINDKHDARIRLVDPRTINHVICRGIKYVIK